MRKVLIVILALGASILTLNAEVSFVANNSVALNSVDSSFVDGVFKGRIKNWPDGSRIKLAVFRRGDLHDEMLRDYLGMNSRQFSNIWNRLIFTGKASEPEIFASEEEMMEYIKETPGALGYVSSDLLKRPVKVLLVE